MKKLTQLILTFTLALGFFGFSNELPVNFIDGGTVVEASGPSQNVFEGKNVKAETDNSEAKSLIEKIRNAANIFAAIVLAISIIMIIVGGLRYILSNGDARSAETGKMILIYSGIGIIIALSAFALGRLFASFGF